MICLNDLLLLNVVLAFTLPGAAAIRKCVWARIKKRHLSPSSLNTLSTATHQSPPTTYVFSINESEEAEGGTVIKNNSETSLEEKEPTNPNLRFNRTICELRYQLVKWNASSNSTSLADIIRNQDYDRCHKVPISLFINIVSQERGDTPQKQMNIITGFLDCLAHTKSCYLCAAVTHIPLDAWLPGANVGDFIKCGRNPTQKLCRDIFKRRFINLRSTSLD